VIFIASETFMASSCHYLYLSYIVLDIAPNHDHHQEVAMNNKYKVLPHYSIEQGAIVDRRMVNRPTDVSLDDSAIQVMTDLNEITPFNIEPTASIDATNEKMIACGVRLLFVTDTENNLLGIVTAKDILGEY